MKKYSVNSVPVGTVVANIDTYKLANGAAEDTPQDVDTLNQGQHIKPSFVMAQFCCLTGNGILTQNKVVEAYESRLQTLSVRVKSQVGGRRVWSEANVANAFEVGAMSRGVVADLDVIEKCIKLNVGPVKALTQSNITKILDTISAYKETIRAYAEVTPILPYQHANLSMIGMYNVDGITTAVVCDSFGIYTKQHYHGFNVETNFEVPAMAANLETNLTDILNVMNEKLSNETLQAAADIISVMPKLKRSLQQHPWDVTRRKLRNAACGYIYGSKNKDVATTFDNPYGEAGDGAVSIDQFGGIWNAAAVGGMNTDGIVPNSIPSTVNIELTDATGISFVEAASLPWGFYGSGVLKVNATADGGTAGYLFTRCFAPIVLTQFMAYEARGTSYAYPTWSVMTEVASARQIPTQGVRSNHSALMSAIRIGIVGALNIVAEWVNKTSGGQNGQALAVIGLLPRGESAAMLGTDVIERVSQFVLDESFDAANNPVKKDDTQTKK